MRILTALNIGYPVVGGAQITHQTYLKFLARNGGHTCLYLDGSRTRVAPACTAVPQDYFRDTAELRAKIEAVRPDVIIGGFTLIHDVIKIGHALGIPVIGWMNSYEYCPPTDQEAAIWQLSHAHRYPNATERAFVLANADALVVNSHYLQQRFVAHTNHTPRVIYPAFDLSSIQFPPAEHKPQYILGVCGYPHKGAKIFLELARRFPHESFLLAGAIHADWYPLFQQQPNLTLTAFRPMRELLAMTRVCLIPSQWDEPFGRIAIEAAANHIPTLVSQRAGLGEIVGDGAQGVREYGSADAWEMALRDLIENASTQQANRAAGQKIAQRFLGDESISQLNDLVLTLVPSHRTAMPSKKVIQLVGDTDALTAFAMINRQMSGALPDTYRAYITREPHEFVPAPVDVVIHHDYTANFSTLPAPPQGHFVAMRTWDFGAYPPAWVKKICAECDQLWVYSNWTKQQAIAGGIPDARVQVIPPGVDPQVFRREGATLPLATTAAFRFLFVGSPVLRKGFDIVLNAYRAAFTSAEDVALVVKDNPRDVFYAKAQAREDIRQFTADANAPTLLYLDIALEPNELAKLYRACNLGVFPYRAEGFALPILEAMACGIPSIVPRFGACLDYCSEATSFFVSAKSIALPVGDTFVYNSLGMAEKISQTNFCEVSVGELSKKMREVYTLWQTDRAAFERHATQGARAARERFTWQHTIQHIERALSKLERHKTPVRFLNSRRANEKQRRVFETARALYLGLGNSAELPVRSR